jgi:hypothetical protein
LTWYSRLNAKHTNESFFHLHEPIPSFPSQPPTATTPQTPTSQTKLQPIPRIIPRKEPLWILRAFRARIRFAGPIHLQRTRLVFPLPMLHDALLQLFQILQTPDFETGVPRGLGIVGRTAERDVDLLTVRRDVEPRSAVRGRNGEEGRDETRLMCLFARRERGQM